MPVYGDYGMFAHFDRLLAPPTEPVSHFGQRMLRRPHGSSKPKKGGKAKAKRKSRAKRK